MRTWRYRGDWYGVERCEADRRREGLGGERFTIRPSFSCAVLASWMGWRLNATTPWYGAEVATTRGSWYRKDRRRRTLPPGRPGSTIRAAGLNFRVRNGIGWIPRAKIADQ